MTLLQTSTQAITGSWQYNEEHKGLQVKFPGKPDNGVIQQLKLKGFRWSRYQGIWYAKDASYRREFLNTIADFEGSVGEKLSFAERMERKVDRAERRIERFSNKAIKLKKIGMTKLERSSEMASIVPFGQPILVGHHSEKRHRALLKRVNNLTHKRIEDINTAKEAERRAEAAKTTLRNLEDPGKIRRKIDRLEAEERKINRCIADATYSLKHGKNKYGWEISKENATASINHYQSLLPDVEEDIAYWKSQLSIHCVKVWGPSDFQKGDRVEGTFGAATVIRVNPKSLTVNYDKASVLGEYLKKYKLPYDSVKNKIKK